MSNSRRDNRKWKRKERNRTGTSDPEKVQLHRERVVQNIEKKKQLKTNYSSIVLSTHLVFKAEEYETELIILSQPITTLPFLVEETESCHYAVIAEKKDFNINREKGHLHQHVARMKALGKPCILEAKNGETKTCSSILDCTFRKWRSELNLPECVK